MQSPLTVVLILLSVLTCFSQIKYEKGYFIDEENNKTECLINNIDWLNNPEQFKYMFTENGEPIVASIEKVKEFRVGENKFIRHSVLIDKSSEDPRKLSTDRNPEWQEKIVYLKALVEGKANLYYFKDPTVVRYFFSVEGRPIEQLIYKLYKVSVTEMGTNKTYLQQLKTHVWCDNIANKEFIRLKYETSPLWNYFKRYNTCSDSSAIDNKINLREGANASSFHVKFTPGVDFSSLYIEQSTGRPNQQFPNATTYRIGFDGELTLPFNKNKWGLFLEPTYQFYKPKFTKEVKYQSLEIPFGLRHYFFLSEEGKVFLNAAVVFDLPFKYEIQYSQVETIIGETMRIGSAFGVGYQYKKVSFEGRLYPKRTQLSHGWFMDYKKFTIIVGFRLF